MAFEQLDYEPHTVRIDGAAKALVDEAEERFDAFYAKQLNKRYSRYVASEPEQVYAALKWVSERGIVPGETFLEWGSGFGVATGLAATLGYQAYGIELRKGLVEIARALHTNQGIDAEFLCSSYIPAGFIAYDIGSGEDIVRDDSFGHDAGSPRYVDGETEVDLQEIDLFFVYPWPGEQEMMLKLFDQVAGEDAILIAYYGNLDTCIYRKL